jgi:hypothetical protein
VVKHAPGIDALLLADFTIRLVRVHGEPRQLVVRMSAAKTTMSVKTCSRVIARTSTWYPFDDLGCSAIGSP